MSDIIGQDVQKVDRIAEARQRAIDEREVREASAEIARVDGVKNRIEQFYWNNLTSIFINDVECAIRRVLATGGAMNVHTGRGELKAWGGDFIVTMPDGTETVFSRESVQILDKASGAPHILAETGEILQVPFGYPDFDEAWLDPSEDEVAEKERLDSDEDDRIANLGAFTGSSTVGSSPEARQARQARQSNQGFNQGKAVPYSDPHQPQGGPAPVVQQPDPTLKNLQDSDRRVFEENQRQEAGVIQREAAKDERKAVTLESPKDKKR